MTTKHWLTSYGDRIPTDIEPYAHPSVAEMLEGAMKRYADKPAFRCFGQTLTYADTDHLSRAFAAYLQQKLGVRKGDRIAVMLPNIPAFPLAMMGIVRVGAVQVNVNPLYTPRELAHQLNDAGVEIIVIFSGASSTLAEIIGKTRVQQVINVALSDGTDAVIASPAVDTCLTSVVSFAVALAEGARLRFTPVPVTGDDLLFLQYTGGTTGVSKGAALSHGNLVANTEQFKAFMPDAFRPGQEVVVTALPLYHIFALMVNFISYFPQAPELAGDQSKGHGWIHRHPEKRAPHRLHGRQYAVYGACHAPEDQGSGFLQFARGHRRRRGRAADHFRTMEGRHRQGHPGRLRPVGNVPDPYPQSDDYRRLLGDGRSAPSFHRHQIAGRPDNEVTIGEGEVCAKRPAGDARLLAKTRMRRCFHGDSCFRNAYRC